MARCKLSVSRLPLGLVLLVMSRFTVFTPTSARQFEWGYATEDNRWWTPQFFKNCWVNAEVNSGPPSVARSSGIPKLLKVRRRQSMRPFSPSRALSMIGQLEYRSTITR